MPEKSTLDSILNGFMGPKRIAVETAVAQVVPMNQADAASTMVLDSTGAEEDVKVNPVVVAPDAIEVAMAGESMLGGKFVIPTENDEDFLNEDEFNMDSELGLRIRKPNGTEFIKMNPAGVFATHMLLYKPNPEAMDENCYWVATELRVGSLVNELRKIYYFPCYSCASKRLFIMPVKVSDTDWFRSLEVLLKQPREFFEANAIRIKAEKELGRYRIKYRADAEPVTWPTKSTAELVTDTLGAANIITSPDHPIYMELTSGEELK